MKKLTIAILLALSMTPAFAIPFTDSTDIGWCRYVPYVGWVCGWHD